MTDMADIKAQSARNSSEFRIRLGAMGLLAMLVAALFVPVYATAGEADGEQGVPHYTVEAEVDPASGRIDAEVDMAWVPDSPTDTQVFLLHRDLGTPEIDSDAVASVQVEPATRFMDAFGAERSFTNRVVVELSRTATPDTPVEIQWRYSGELRNEHIRLGASLVSPHWLELQVGSVWLPVTEDLRSPFTHETELRLPPGYEVISSGPVDRVDGAHHLRSATPLPMVPVIASDRFQTRQLSGDGPAVTVYHAGTNEELVSWIGENAAELLAFYDDLFQTGREVADLRVTIPPEPRARPNGYARPGLIALKHGAETNRSTFNLLAHEAAHLWWLDATQTQSRHNFLNESFAEYALFLAARETHGEEVFQEHIQGAREASAELPAIRDWNARQNHPLMYRKGPWLLHQLHERIGHEAFLGFVRGLQRESVGTLEDMIEVLEQTTDAETASWFDRKLSF